MSDFAIKVENLSKRYTISHQRANGDGLRHILQDKLTAPFRKLFHRNGASPSVSQPSTLNHQLPPASQPSSEDFYALRDVSFEIKQGEVVGIIGRNGAGKSTLLKILSRITEPTSGRITINGRVASLLEVGTGFHPELTGRENIFLNGAILGMSRAEILAKFDEIVAFAEIERFLDTPVKRYSSGMYVRLAFAVAAHLEPEILIIDEVLAVGDVEFQKKCLGKMQDIGSSQGRTVLFVSHNMEAVLKLCTRGIQLTAGGIVKQGSVGEVIASYLEGQLSSTVTIDLSKKSRPLGTPVKLRFARVSPANVDRGWSMSFGQSPEFDVFIEAAQSHENIELGIGLFSARGFEVASWTSTYARKPLSLRAGLNSFRITFPNLFLLPGQYSFGFGLRNGRGLEDYLPEAVLFEVVASDRAAKANVHTFGGIIVPEVEVHSLD